MLAIELKGDFKLSFEVVLVAIELNLIVIAAQDTTIGH